MEIEARSITSVFVDVKMQIRAWPAYGCGKAATSTDMGRS